MGQVANIHRFTWEDGQVGAGLGPKKAASLGKLCRYVKKFRIWVRIST